MSRLSSSFVTLQILHFSTHSIYTFPFFSYPVSVSCPVLSPLLYLILSYSLHSTSSVFPSTPFTIFPFPPVLMLFSSLFLLFTDPPLINFPFPAIFFPPLLISPFRLFIHINFSLKIQIFFLFMFPPLFFFLSPFFFPSKRKKRKGI